MDGNFNNESNHGSDSFAFSDVALKIAAIADNAFQKALAAVIVMNFPFVNIVSIILAVKSLKLVKQADNLALEYSLSAGGKNIAARLLCIFAIMNVCVGVFVVLFIASCYLILFLILFLVALFE